MGEMITMDEGIEIIEITKMEETINVTELVK